MSPSAEVLFKLLRIALGNEKDFSLPLSVNWKEVIDLSFEQGVAAIAVDGLQRIYDGIESRESKEGVESLEALDSPELEDLKYEWFGEVMNCEQDCASKQSVALRFSKALANKDIKPISLKGFSYASYYPVPSHRQSSDIDLFLQDANEKGNQIAETLGASVKRDHYEEKVISMDGVTIENHKYCIGIRGSRKASTFERHLERMLDTNSLTLMPECGLWKPDATFNALYYIAHSVKHFCSEMLNVRQLMDWAVILKAEQENIDWPEFYRWTDYMGYSRFANTVTAIAIECFGVEVDTAKVYSDSTYKDRLLADTFEPMALDAKSNSIWKNRYNLVMRKLCNGWKYHRILHKSVVGEVLQNVWGVLFERNPEL